MMILVFLYIYICLIISIVVFRKNRSFFVYLISILFALSISLFLISIVEYYGKTDIVVTAMEVKNELALSNDIVVDGIIVDGSRHSAIEVDHNIGWIERDDGSLQWREYDQPKGMTNQLKIKVHRRQDVDLALSVSKWHGICLISYKGKNIVVDEFQDGIDNKDYVLDLSSYIEGDTWDNLRVILFAVVFIGSFLLISFFLSKSISEDAEIIIKKISGGAIVSFLFFFIICLYAPIEMYALNKTDFGFGISSVLIVQTIALITLCSINTLIFYIIRVFNTNVYYVSVLLEFAIILILYIHGTFLVNGLGIIDGALKYDASRENKTISIMVFLCVASALVIMTLILKCKKMITIVQYFSLGLILVLLISGLYLAVSNGAFKLKKEYAATEKDLTCYSSKKNVVVIVLDWCDSGEFIKALSMDNEIDYCGAFKDFTYYDNVLGTYPYTYYSIPMILTGEKYYYQKDFDIFCRESFDDSELFKRLNDEKYTIGLYDSHFWGVYECSNDFINTISNVEKRETRILSSLDFFITWENLVAYRYLPYHFKNYCHFSTNDFKRIRETRIGDGYRDYSWDNISFYEKCNQGVTLCDSDATFKFIHLEGGHPSFHLNKYLEEVGYRGRDFNLYEEQLLGCAYMLKAYLQAMKDAGVYDNTAIIIMADHGCHVGDNNDGYEGVIEYGQNPLFMVKGFNENHEKMNISDIATSYDFFLEGLIKVVDGQKGNLLFEDNQNNRTFLYYPLEYGDYKMMTEYSCKGKAGNANNMTPTGNIYYYSK